MNETLALILAWVAGLLLGAFFFAGLWWTVRKGLASPRPGIWFLGSLLLRAGIVLTGFHYVSDGHGVRLMLCLLGFLVARMAITWFTRQHGREVDHAD